MRTFIAVPLSKSVKDELQQLQVRTDSVRWQSPEQMHITLKFLGEITAEEVTGLKQGLAGISVASFELKLQELGMFPQKGNPKVIWIGVAPDHKITQLHQAVEARCSALGFETDKRPFLPHITLGRVQKEWPRNRIKNLLEEPKPVSFSVTSFGIYKSELNADGAVHTLIKKYPLPDKSDNG